MAGRVIATFLTLSSIGCSQNPELASRPLPSAGNTGSGAGGSQTGGGGGVAAIGGASTGGSSAGQAISFGGQPACQSKTCMELGWACGSVVDEECGTVINCADEGLSCGALEACIGGLDRPTECTTGFGPCQVCSAIPDCSAAPNRTQLTGRVVTPGRNDADTANQVGVPNAVVYILRNTDLNELPPIPSGIPTGGTSCDRCEDQNLGPVLLGTVTDATGRFTLEGTIPVGVEFVLVVKAGRFRRVVTHSLPMTAACQTTALATTLPDNPTRLPRAMSDGLAVNIPTIAVSTGQLDAMECVLEKMGLAHTEFGNPGGGVGASPRVHLYRGGATTGTPPGSGARIDDTTPHDTTLYGDLARLQSYDLVIADCEGQNYDSSFAQRDDSGARLREYVNRGGRMFASHLSFSWLHQNGDAAFDPVDPIATGLAAAASWSTMVDSMSATGTGVVSLGRPNASPRIQNFADWMASEGVTMTGVNSFEIFEPRSQNTAVGEASEEFVFRDGGNGRVQQFSFNTPYAAPAEAICGRVAYSGFHVSIGDTSNAIFPNHCVGSLTAQEKVLLYMLFDLGACVGDVPPPPDCVPTTCEAVQAQCGLVGDGCGDVLNCGVCPPPR